MFFIVRVKYLSSNIPIKIFYVALKTKSFRIARTTTETENYMSLCAKTVS